MVKEWVLTEPQQVLVPAPGETIKHRTSFSCCGLVGEGSAISSSRGEDGPPDAFFTDFCGIGRKVRMTKAQSKTKPQMTVLS